MTDDITHINTSISVLLSEWSHVICDFDNLARVIASIFFYHFSNMTCIRKTVYYKLYNCLLVSLETYAVLRVKLSDEAIEKRCTYSFFIAKHVNADFSLH